MRKEYRPGFKTYYKTKAYLINEDEKGELKGTERANFYERLARKNEKRQKQIKENSDE